MRKKSKLKISLFCLSFISQLFFLFSCKQITPELSEANYSVIFEYDDLQSLPASRLSFFMKSESDIDRYNRIKIKSLETGYVWDFDDVAKISQDYNQWAGNTNLVPPYNEIIPTGMYEVTFYNADEKNTSIYVTVSYDKSFNNKNAEEMEEYMRSHNGRKRIAIYDDNDILLYYGDKIREFDSPEGIRNYYRTSSYSYDVWSTSGNYVICIFPIQDLKTK